MRHAKTLAIDQRSDSPLALSLHACPFKQALSPVRPNMHRSRTVAGKLPSQPRATGRDGPEVIRLTDELLEKVDAWAYCQDNKPDRSEAIRRLLEIALANSVAQPPRAATDAKRKSSRERAKELASVAIDRLGDAGATSGARASRKGMLMEGPEEFSRARRDRPGR
jgi:hypothetical protein